MELMELSNGIVDIWRQGRFISARAFTNQFVLEACYAVMTVGREGHIWVQPDTWY